MTTDRYPIQTLFVRPGLTNSTGETQKQSWLLKCLLIPAGILPPAKYPDLAANEASRRKISNGRLRIFLLDGPGPGQT